MQTSSLLQSPPPFWQLPSRRHRTSFSVLAMRRSDDKNEKRGHDHKLVDENMVVLKMRIRETMIKEQETRVATPDHWMGWEKEWYKNYESDVYELVGFLQILMMNNRPSLVVGVLALLMFSVVTSLVLVLSYLAAIVM